MSGVYAAAGGLVEVCGLCYCQRPGGGLWSLLLFESVLMSISEGPELYCCMGSCCSWAVLSLRAMMVSVVRVNGPCCGSGLC